MRFKIYHRTVLVWLFVLLTTGCATSVPASPVNPDDANAVLQSQSPMGAEKPSASQSPEAPVPPKPPGVPSDILNTYLKLTDGNIPNAKKVMTTTGSECWIRYGGKISEVSAEADISLVSYDFPFATMPDDCMVGSQFQLPVSEIAQMKQEAQFVNALFTAQARFMDKYSDVRPPLPPAPKPIIGWVRVMNLQPVHNASNSFVFWSLCNLYEYATSRLSGDFSKVADTPWGTLAYVTADATLTSTDACPTGTLVLLEDQQPEVDGVGIPMLFGYDKYLPLL